jgi:hypothetical protein
MISVFENLTVWMDVRPNISTVFGSLTGLFCFSSFLSFLLWAVDEVQLYLLSASDFNRKSCEIPSCESSHDLGPDRGYACSLCCAKRILDVTNQRFISDMDTVFAEDPHGGLVCHA